VSMHWRWEGLGGVLEPSSRSEKDWKTNASLLCAASGADTDGITDFILPWAAFIALDSSERKPTRHLCTQL
jgi:hypothetical protein